MTSRPYARILAEYVCKLDYSKMPTEATHACKLHILDTLGVAIAGTRTPWGRIVLDYAGNRAVRGQSTMLGTWARTESTVAAFVNGTLSHSLDYDDDPGICHIGAVVVPASLAVAEERNNSGRELIVAVNLGYDIVTRIEEALNGEDMFSRGFHPTAVCGVFGAAASSGKILGLNDDEMTNAFGIAGSFASGLMEFLADGSMTKRLHPGWAAQGGINAALLAKKGFTGPQTIFEGRFGLRAYSGSFDGNRLTAHLGERFDVMNSSLKKYPSCLYNAPAIDAILDIREKERISPEDIKRIDVRVRRTAMELVGEPIERKQNPQTVLDAQMSMPFSLAVAFVDGEAYLTQFTERKIRDQEIISLARRIRISADRELDKLPRSDLSVVLEVELNDGKKITKKVDHHRGDPRNPLTEPEILEKFTRCAGTVLKPEETESLANKILDIDGLVEARALLAGLGSPPSSTLSPENEP